MKIRIFAIGLLFLAAFNLFGQEGVYLGNSKRINDSIRSRLDSMSWRTIKPRNNYFDAVEKYGPNSDVALKNLMEMQKIDSLLLKEVLDIYSRFGWPKISQVGEMGANWAFIQIQHADLQTQLKFIPIIYNAAILGEADKYNFALLLDRVLSDTGEKQLYGTQYTGYTYPNGERKAILWPVSNFDSLNRRRRKMGLSRIEKQLKRDDAMYDSTISISEIKSQRVNKR